MTKSGILRFAVATVVIVGAAGAGINLAHDNASPRKDSPLRLVLNVPAHRLYVFEHGKNTKVFKVSVGMVGHQTPAGTYRISQAIWNPWWHPPASPWAEGRKPEPPGPDNPMGRVKMNFAPLLYIHGTNDKVALGDPASHGCVRLLNEDLIELTRLVQSYATPGIDQDALERLAENPDETKEFNFRNAVPFEVVYNVASINNNFLYIYPDVYRKIKPEELEAQVRDVLAEHGIPFSEVDRTRLDRLLAGGRKARVAMSLDTLLAPVAAAALPASAHRRR
jgi:murein L,D-transpeptidase YcbB/YkuD